MMGEDKEKEIEFDDMICTDGLSGLRLTAKT